MIARLLVFLLMLPFLEFLVFKRVYSWLKADFGAQMAVEIIILSLIVLAVIGVRLIKRQSARLMQTLRSGGAPGGQALNGTALIVSGVLLVIPGYLTDLFAVMILFPGVRQWMARRVEGAVLKRFRGGGFQVFHGSFGGFDGGSPFGTTRPTSADRPKEIDDQIIDVEARDT